MASLSTLFNQLPPQLRNRFNGIPTFAKGIVEAEEKSLPKIERTKPEQMEQIQLIVQLILLDRFFRKGTTVAKQAVAQLERIGVTGFSVGTTTFEGENEAVMRGARLSEDLRTAVPGLKELVQDCEAESASQLVLSIRKRVRSA